MSNRLFILIYSLSCCYITSAQLDLPAAFTQKLEAAQIDLTLPLENKFKSTKVESSTHMPYDFAIRSKKEKLEIRYFIDLFEEEGNFYKAIPQVQAMQLLTNIAKNDEDAVTAIHRIENKDLKEIYQADWGMIAYFQPKTSFSNFSDCKMLALFKEEQAIAYVFYLFNGSNNTLEQYSSSIIFP